MKLKDKLDDVAGDVGEQVGKAGRRAGDVGLAVGQRVVSTGSSAAGVARDGSSELSSQLRRVDPKETADSAIWGLQAGSKVPGGPYSTALGTGLGAAYGAYSSAREDTIRAMEDGIEIDVEDEGEPVDQPAGDGSMAASPSVPRRTSEVLPGNFDVEQASAMAVSSYDWYKTGQKKWGTKGGVAGAAFGVARHLVMGGSKDEPRAE